MVRFLTDLGVTSPVVAAPMSGGPTTPALVVAAAQERALAFVAAGYKPPELVADQIREVGQATPLFGVNLFAPNPVPVDRSEFRRYAEEIQPVAEKFGVARTAVEPLEDDDGWNDKLDLLLADPVPVVSFTFGIPDSWVFDRIRRAGTLVAQTVTSAEEAGRADEAGAQALVVQAAAAGGHWGTVTPGRPPEPLPLLDLVSAVKSVSRLPVIAAGGVSTPDEVAAVLAGGATAVAVGTVLLRADESGASAVHKAALADRHRGQTVHTRAFTGRPARGLPNDFIARFDRAAPLGYPAIHHLTAPVRRAAAAAGDPEAVNLWAGTGYRNATAEPAATILHRLASGV